MSQNKVPNLTWILGFAAITILSLLFKPIHTGAHRDDWAWLLAYRDQGESALARDKEFIPFLHAQLPRTPLPSWSNTPADRAAVTFLTGVPGYIAVRENRYLEVSGCPAHACVARSLLWVDTEAHSVVFIVTADEKTNDNPATRDQYRVAGASLEAVTQSDLDPAHLPAELRGAIIRWLHTEGILSLGTVTLLRPSGSAAITTNQLCWTGGCSNIKWN